MRNLATLCALPGLLSACSVLEQSRHLNSEEDSQVVFVIGEIRRAMPIMCDFVDYADPLFDAEGNSVSSNSVLKTAMWDTYEYIVSLYEEDKILVSSTAINTGYEADGLAPREDEECGLWGGEFGNWMILSPKVFGGPYLVRCIAHEGGHRDYNAGDYGHLPEIMADPDNGALIVDVGDYPSFYGDFAQNVVDSSHIADASVFGWDENSAVEAVDGSSNFSDNPGYDSRFHFVYGNTYASFFEDMLYNPELASDTLEDFDSNAGRDVSDDLSAAFYDRPATVFGPMGVTPDELGTIVKRHPDYYADPRKNIIKAMDKALVTEFDLDGGSGVFEF
ncbi:MAG: hypothetical protein WC653_03430 [Candidatus Gracilibacteria bacterium]